MPGSKSNSQASYTPSQRIHNLPFNFLFTSEADICLLYNLHGFERDTTITTMFSGIICKTALQQKLPPAISHMRHYDRLNMIHQIPELGVVAVGSQIGRVALLTMTHWDDSTMRIGLGHPKSNEAFKISAILPFHSQEKKDVRPEQPLLGMAFSPIQGQGTRTQGPGGMPRTYRLLMTYYDHTILSYEIYRETPEDELMVF